MAHSKASRAGTPKLSVVMPVHNALPYLDLAVESILGQTFADFEFVILDDASTDGSTGRLREWAGRDPRIRLIEVAENLGPVLSSERVARAASAPVIARMDADDISLPIRLLEQFELLEKRAEVGLVACLSETIDGDGRKIRGAERWRLARTSRMAPFAHGAMMFRTELFERVGGYRAECVYWEDQDLALRMAQASKALVIPKALLQVRQSATSIRSSSSLDALERSLDAMYRSMEGDGRPHAAGKIDPRAFVSLGSVTLWAGGRPRLFKRLLRRARLRPDRRSLAALAWTGWASASPGTLRAFLDLLLAGRNALAGGADEPVEWPRSRA